MSRLYDVKYVSGSGTEVSLSGPPYFWGDNNLHNYAWDYSFSSKNSGHGAVIKRLARGGRAYDIEIRVFNPGGDTIPEALNDLHAIFDADLLAETPGKLYVGAQYLEGYFVESNKTEYTTNKRYIKLTAKFITGSPFWITPDLHSFPIFTAGADSGFILPTALPLRIGAVLSAAQLINDHYAPSSAIITIYGPATDPSITIGSWIYSVSGELGVGERYEIDQINRSVTKITQSGERINAFNLRGKTYSVFQPIPAGDSTVYYNGDFAVDVVLLKERSEPLWT
jgi:hypothetical protein